MKIKNIFSRRKLKPYFVYGQKGNIWRMHFSGGDFLVCETRDMDSRQTFFFTLDYRKKQIYLSNFQLDEKWWVSVESCTDDLVFFNYFRTPELPEHKGITAVDLRTGETRWTNPDLAFLFADGSELYAYEEKHSGDVYHKLSISDGKIVETYEDDKIAASLLELKRFNEERIFAGIIYPEMYVPGQNEPGDTEKYFAHRFEKVRVSGVVEFVDLNNLLIYNFHAETGIGLHDLTSTLLTNTIEIFDKKAGKIIHEEILNSDAVNYVPDSFFVKDGILFYVREKKELVLIEINRLLT